MRCGGPGEDKYGQATPRGAKIIQQPSSSTTRFVWRGASDWQCLEERDGSDDLVARYTYAPGYIDSPAVQERDLNSDDDFSDANEVVYYHSSTLYSVYALSNSASSAVERYRYDAYGAATVLDADFSDDADNASDVENPYLFQSRRWDNEVDLYHFRNRVMTPVLGRFLQRYPVPAIGVSVYEFVQSRAGVLTDPFGTKTVAECYEDYNDCRTKARNRVGDCIAKALGTSYGQEILGCVVGCGLGCIVTGTGWPICMGICSAACGGTFSIWGLAKAGRCMTNLIRERKKCNKQLEECLECTE